MEKGLKTFKPCEDLLRFASRDDYGVLVLNSPCKMVNETFWKIWNNAKVRMLVDGGSNSWMSWIKNKNELNLPHLVTGDFDSIEPETLKLLKKKRKVVVTHTPDQNETDFTKALREFGVYTKNHKLQIKDIYVLIEVVGRMDHLLANINTLFKVRDILKGTNVFLLSSDSISWLLHKGLNDISIPESLSKNEEWCGLIPIGHPAIVSTRGLKWNLKKTRLQFGSVVSTSNTYGSSPNVEIDTDSSIFWTMGIANLFC